MQEIRAPKKIAGEKVKIKIKEVKLYDNYQAYSKDSGIEDVLKLIDTNVEQMNKLYPQFVNLSKMKEFKLNYFTCLLPNLKELISTKLASKLKKIVKELDKYIYKSCIKDRKEDDTYRQEICIQKL